MSAEPIRGDRPDTDIDGTKPETDPSPFALEILQELIKIEGHLAVIAGFLAKLKVPAWLQKQS
jgi:hypothetical protein